MAAPTQKPSTVLSAAGRRDLQERLARAEEELAEVTERLRTGAGDPELVAEHQQLVNQVEAWKAVLERAVDVGSVEEDPSIVEVGDEVDVEMPDGEIDTYALVDPVEARAVAGRVSVTSPLGRALLGARPNEEVTVNAPGGAYTVVVRARRRLT